MTFTHSADNLKSRARKDRLRAAIRDNDAWVAGLTEAQKAEIVAMHMLACIHTGYLLAVARRKNYAKNAPKGASK